MPHHALRTTALSVVSEHSKWPVVAISSLTVKAVKSSGVAFTGPLTSA